jgi:outer membrane biosynthesis protein TonB
MLRDVLLPLAIVAMFTQTLRAGLTPEQMDAAIAEHRRAAFRDKPIPWLKDQKKFAIYTPKPQYPPEAVARHITASGIFVIRVHVKTGLVVSAWASQGTASPLLDSAAIRAFSQWRFQPGALTPIGVVAPQLHDSHGKEDALLKVPITFSL